jgi:hypothetical protein
VKELLDSGIGFSPVALSKTLLKELSYGSRFTFVANWHPASNHPSGLATRRPARLGVTNTEQAADTGQQISLARVIGYARRIGARGRRGLGPAELNVEGGVSSVARAV